MRVLSTTDYKIFKILPYNRELKESHVLAVEKSIRECNLLPLRPIIVNKEFFVLDGQHRLEAAKRNGWEIYYTVCEIQDEKVMIQLNRATRPWTERNWVNFFAEKGSDRFLEIKKALEETDWLTSGILRVLKSYEKLSGRLETIETMPQETFDHKIRFIRKSAEIRKNIIESSGENFKFLRSDKAQTALFYFLNRKSVDSEEFLEKAIYKLDMIKICSSTSAYMEMFLRIYNFGKRDKISLDE